MATTTSSSSATSSIELSTVKPDPESILLQMQLFLQDKSSWVDMQTSSTGETLLELLAAVGGMNQFGIEGAFRDAFISTAARPSAVYAAARMLGVRIGRKYPAGVDVSLKRADTTLSSVVPKFTQFQINGSMFFNRDPLMFSAGSAEAAERVYYGAIKAILSQRSLEFDTEQFNAPALEDGDQYIIVVNSGLGYGASRKVEYNTSTFSFDLVDGQDDWPPLTVSSRVSVLTTYVRLYQGTVQTESYLSDGTAFKSYELSEGSFNISDVDVQVTVTSPTGDSVEWTTLSDGLWVADISDTVYDDSTSGEGNTVIMFGNGEHGKIPTLASTVTFKYAITNGSAGNTGLTGLAVTCPTDETMKGTTISVITGGADEKPYTFYQVMAPLLYRARKRAVTKSDYKATCLAYPGIISADIKAQRDIAPDDLRWMNVVQICLLPLDTSSTALTTTEWSNFLSYFNTKEHALIHISKKEATKQMATVQLTLVLKSTASPASTIPAAETALNALFARRSDTLGRRITLNDIDRKAAVTGVDYVDIEICHLETDTDTKVDLVPTDSTHFIELTNLTINTRYSEREIYYS